MTSNRVRSLPTLNRGYKVWNHPVEDVKPSRRSISSRSLVEPLREEGSSNGHSHSHSINLANPYLRALEVDRLTHLGLIKRGNNLVNKFSDVKFVCMGESVKRIERTTHLLKKQLNLKEPVELIDADRDRFTMYKHGIGVPSLTILLNEIFKLLSYANCEDVIIFRLGTCGSIGKPPGSLILTSKALDDRKRPIFEQVVLGRVVALDASVDQELVQELHTIGRDELPDLDFCVGTTMATNDFYEGQGRITGAFCAHTSAERNRHLLGLKKFGIICIEMEANAFHALCAKAKIRAATVDVVTADLVRGDLVGDEVESRNETIELRPAMLVAKYIRKHLDFAAN